jgi:hypothetical protein
MHQKSIALSQIATQKEKARDKNYEYQQERCAALPNNKNEEVRAKNHEYQRSHRARLKAKDDASKSIASSQITAQKEKARAKNYEYQ